MASDMPDRAVAAVETAKRYYLAMVSGDQDELRTLFDARAAIAGHFEGEFLWQDLESFIAEAKSLVGQHGKHECAVESVRIDGDIATIAIRGRYAGLWFVDHLSLIEVDGRWIIASKSFHVVP